MKDSTKRIGLLTLGLAALVGIAGCTPAEPSAPVGEPTTSWREKPQQEVSAEGGYLADTSATSRQDGPKDVKVLTPKVSVTDSITGNKSKADKETVFNVTVVSITEGGSGGTAYALERNSKGKTVPAVVNPEGLKPYTITLNVNFTSGWDQTAPHDSPLFWPVTANGSTTAVTDVKLEGAMSQTVTITAFAQDGNPPVGVRFQQLTSKGEALMPIVDIFPVDESKPAEVTKEKVED